jgi:uncharacterized DUF497 family protein
MALSCSYTMIIYQRFEWDVREASKNLTGRGITFKEASTVFSDETHTVTADAGSRMRAVGRSDRGRSLVVVYELGPRIRIVSAEKHVPGAVRPPSEPAPAPEVVAAPVSKPEGFKPEGPKANGHAARANGHSTKANGHAAKTNGHATTARAAAAPATPVPDKPSAPSAPSPPPSKREPRPGSWKAAARILAERLAAEERAREGT